ncbi:MAG: PEP-CTERM sorting domain-containing protein [Planctomycetota bacterium]
MSDWEIKGTSSFSFELGTNGFTTLLPSTFRTDGNNTALTVAEKIALTTWNVDMAAYNGGTGIITLVDFLTDASRSGGVSGDTNDIIFQAANLSILNAGNYSAALQWDDATEAVQLNIFAVPEPSSLTIVGLLCGFCTVRRRRSC